MLIKKGNLGYINNRKFITTIRTVILFGISLSIYFAGLAVLKTNKSLITIISILGMLPAAKSMVNMIMFFRFSSVKPDKYTEYKNRIGFLPALYEMVLTTTEKSYYVPVMVCANKSLCLLSRQKDSDIKKLENHLNTSLKASDHKGILVKVFKDEKAFYERLNSLSEHFNEAEDNSYKAVFSTIEAISL